MNPEARYVVKENPDGGYVVYDSKFHLIVPVRYHDKKMAETMCTCCNFAHYRALSEVLSLIREL